MDVSLYLKRIGYDAVLKQDLGTLVNLHQAHVFAVPFEDLDIHLGIPIKLELDALYRKVVEGNRGGFCYELNTLFCQFLKQLGYDSTIISAQIINKGELGPDYDHMAVWVKLETNWLIDVGFGDLFIQPIEVKPDIVQFDGFNYFIVKQLGPETYSLWMSPDEIVFDEKYMFHLVEVPIDDFQESCYLKQTSENSYFVKNIVCTKPTLLGRKTLFNNRITIREHAQKEVVSLTDKKEIIQLLQREFAIDVSIYQDKLFNKIQSHLSSSTSKTTA